MFAKTLHCPRCKEPIVAQPSTKKLLGVFAVKEFPHECRGCGAQLWYTPDGSEVVLARNQRPPPKG